MKFRVVDALQRQSPSLLRKMFDMAPPGSVNLGLGQPVIPVPEVLRRAAEPPAFAGYSQNLGILRAREAVAAAVNRSPSEVMLTVGSQHALTLALFATLQPGDEVLIPDPAFPVYDMTAQWLGATPRHYTLRADNGFQPDPAEIKGLITPRTKLAVINTPSNPTGVCWQASVLQEILGILAAAEVPYLSDEVYQTLAFSAVDGAPVVPALPSTLCPEGGFSTNSLSKMFAAMGWRLGWLIAPSDVLQQMVPLQQITVACASTPAQEAVVAAFSPEGIQAAAEISLELAARRKLTLSLLRDYLPELPQSPSDGALYLFVDTSAIEPDDLKLAVYLLEHRVITIPGCAFGSAGRGRLRLTFGATPQDLREGIQRLAQGLRAYKSR